MNTKTAIVTGASSGFGFLSALGLAQAGYNVLATARSEEKAAKLLQTAENNNVSDHIHIHLLDVTSPDSVTDLKRRISDFPSVDVLVNNAGFAQGGFSEELSVEDYKRQFDTNLFGVISVTQAVLPIMREQKSGRIINMGSISGKVGFPGLSAYTASKHAIEGYSESLRLEVQPFGIDVSIIEAGSYKTNIWSGIDKTRISKDSPYHSYMKAILKEIQSGKALHGNPQEIADLVVSIASARKRPKLRYPVGKGVKRNIAMKNLLPWEAIEKAVLKSLGR
ncbi:SDR family oxidoreductase [Mesobacillus zeae]|uniref:SDR family oxidoreductase n=1 Tax=Mesobacillus zeae TaxID=1917180 RepID=A0A398B6W3_9BACI|nr:SDR family oxidoreductase [Mesobacillus zeae]RID85859.1 SDR family oxidoreductase [Mesobacillus zeae]